MGELLIALVGLSLVALGTLISLWLAIVLLIGLFGAFATLVAWLAGMADEAAHWSERHPHKKPAKP